MTDPSLPPCGIYRTVRAIGSIPQGRLVYFHNHGDPGPGLYLPARWVQNRAEFAAQGEPLSSPTQVADLEPLEVEGFYRVVSPFVCCEKRCRTFETDTLVQLGYDGEANPILFEPRIEHGHFSLPERGSRIDRERMVQLQRLRVPIHAPHEHPEHGPTVH